MAKQENKTGTIIDFEKAFEGSEKYEPFVDTELFAFAIETPKTSDSDMSEKTIKKS